MPSEASVKFFDETFFQKSFDLALDLSGRQPEKKLGKQRSVFPGRRSASAVNSRLGAVSYAHACANHRCTCAPAAQLPSPSCLWHDTLACRLGQALNGAHWAPAPPKGGGETWLSLRGRYVPVGRCPAAGLRCRVGRCWTSATGRQHPRRQPRNAPPFPDGGAVALSALLWRAPPPKGEARLGFLQASGELPTWLPLWGSWHGGSRD